LLVIYFASQHPFGLCSVLSVVVFGEIHEIHFGGLYRSMW